METECKLCLEVPDNAKWVCQHNKSHDPTGEQGTSDPDCSKNCSFISISNAEAININSL